MRTMEGLKSGMSKSQEHYLQETTKDSVRERKRAMPVYILGSVQEIKKCVLGDLYADNGYGSAAGRVYDKGGYVRV